MPVLVINFLLYFLYTLYGFKKCRYLTVHNAISAWFAVVSFMGIVAVYTEVYQAVFGKIHINDITPYLFCFLSFLFLIYPLRKLNCRNIELVNLDLVKEHRFKKMSYVPLLILLIYILALIPDVIVCLTMQDISDVYHEQRVEGTDLFNHSILVERIFWISRKVYNWFWAIFVFYSIYSLNNRNIKSKKYFIILFFSAIIPYFLRTIISGGRGGFIFFSIQIVLVLIPLWSILTTHTKKRVIFYSSIAVCIFALYISMMTIARFSESQSETPLTSIVRYFGEPFPNLGNNLYGHVKQHLMGRRMYPELFGFDLGNNTQYQLFAIWQHYSGVAVLNYKTIFGDFYLEFGTFYALLIIFSMGFLMNLYLSKHRLFFHQIPLYAYYVTICSTAPLWFNQKNTGDLLVVIQLLLISCLIKYYLLVKQNRK